MALIRRNQFVLAMARTLQDVGTGSIRKRKAAVDDCRRKVLLFAEKFARLS
jgi:hypothetical protein